MPTIKTTDGEFTLVLPDGPDVQETDTSAICPRYKARWISLTPVTLPTKRKDIDEEWHKKNCLPTPWIAVAPGSLAGWRSQMDLGTTTCRFLVWDKDDNKSWEFSLQELIPTLTATLTIQSRGTTISL